MLGNRTLKKDHICYMIPNSEQGNTSIAYPKDLRKQSFAFISCKKGLIAIHGQEITIRRTSYATDQDQGFLRMSGTKLRDF